LKNKKRYLKIHVAADIKSKKILSMHINDEHVHNYSKALTRLIEYIIQSDNSMVPIGKLYADGAYMMIMRFLNS
jgi:hypothetical protein